MNQFTSRPMIKDYIFAWYIIFFIKVIIYFHLERVGGFLIFNDRKSKMSYLDSVFSRPKNFSKLLTFFLLLLTKILQKFRISFFLLMQTKMSVSLLLHCNLTYCWAIFSKNILKKYNMKFWNIHYTAKGFFYSIFRKSVPCLSLFLTDFKLNSGKFYLRKDKPFNKTQFEYKCNINFSCPQVKILRFELKNKPK